MKKLIIIRYQLFLYLFSGLFPILLCAQNSEKKSIIFTEIFPDPTPTIGLPEREFVEIYNITKDTINLDGYQICDRDKCFSFNPQKLAPFSSLILCKSSDILFFNSYGKTLGFSSFITLNNDGDSLFLKNKSSEIIDFMGYNSSIVPEGRTIELNNLYSECTLSSNWQASKELIGGTPGSLSEIQKSKELPPETEIKSVIALEDSLVEITLNNAINPSSLSKINIFIDEESIEIKNLNFSSESNKITLKIKKSLFNSFYYNFQIKQLRDCYLRSVSEHLIYKLLLPAIADSGDIVFNEILFNPKVGGVDFIELINVSTKKIIDLKNWKLNNKNEAINSFTISSETMLIEPLQIIAFTSNTDILSSNYTHIGNIHKSSLPSFNDDNGTAAIFLPNNQLSDIFSYDEKMHFRMLKEKEGVSLEKIFPNVASNNKENWNSASEQSGFATPGLINSQSKNNIDFEEEWQIEPIAFNPFGGSNKDFTTIKYSVKEPSNILVTLLVYNHEGRKIKTIAQNTTISSEGFLKWDGTNDDGNFAPCGQYLIYIQTTNLKGIINDVKKQVVITSF
ncbi:MAG: hypothetical protein EAZ07_07825 [Cytophagales bacterium]|nr:MAG: hypothetical protein EAZ07_07825 [Cytophagales bacterium]